MKVMMMRKKKKKALKAAAAAQNSPPGRDDLGVPRERKHDKKRAMLRQNSIFVRWPASSNFQPKIKNN